MLLENPTISWTLLDPELLVLVAALVVSFVFLSEWLKRSNFGASLPAAPPAPPLNDEQRAEVVGWERDRILSAAKGLATTSAGFLVTLATILLKGELDVPISAWSVAGLILGSVGVLGIAAHLANTSRSFVEGNLP
jgi:hypothetical protein